MLPEKKSHMRMRRKENLQRGMTQAEKAFKEDILKVTGLKWYHQRICHWRLFDFFNPTLGVAFEIDGPEHDEDIELMRDRMDWFRERILVIRIRNFNIHDSFRAVILIRGLETWEVRKKKMRSNRRARREEKKYLVQLGKELSEIKSLKASLKSQNTAPVSRFDKGDPITL